MGRAFEFRRARKEKRWGKMAVAFTKLSKEITLAAKVGGRRSGNKPPAEGCRRKRQSGKYAERQN